MEKRKKPTMDSPEIKKTAPLGRQRGIRHGRTIALNDLFHHPHDEYHFGRLEEVVGVTPGDQ